MREGPPRHSRRILDRLLPDDLREDMLADLDRLWEERRRRGGRRRADRWYRGQVLRAVGPSLGEAVARGLRAPGGVEGAGTLLRDVRGAARQLARHPGVGGVVVLTLALGIGATTAVFSVVHGVLLRPLPYERPSELVMVTSRAGGSSLPRHVSGPDAVEMAEGVPGIASVAGFGEATVGPLIGTDRPEHVVTVPMTWNLPDVLGIDVALGRRFDGDDGVPAPLDGEGAATSALISHDLWVRSFGGDRSVIGRVVHVWGGATRIVGVLHEGFRLAVPPELNIPADADVWEALRRDVRDWPREGRWLRTVARLREGASIARATREVDAFAERLRRTHPHHAAERTELRVRSLEDAMAAPMVAPLWLLMSAVALVLLVACANVGNLLLARGAARADEMALRAHLGATRSRLIRQLLVESTFMAALGAVGGVLLAALGVEALEAVRPADLHRLEAARLDLPVLGFALLVTVAATLGAGLLPALHTVGSGSAGRLRGRAAKEVPERARAVLVTGEVALSVVLLVGAGLLIRTFVDLQRTPLGFEPERVLTVTATQPLRPAGERRAYEAELRRAAEAVPGVTAAGIVFPLPMNGVYERTAEYVPDGRADESAAWTTAWARTVSPTYFAVMGIETRRGRVFRESDEDTDVPVAVVDERLAAREFPGRSPVGERLRVRGLWSDTLGAEIVGVVEYAPQGDHRDTRPTVYLPRTFYRSHEVSLVARVAGDPTLLMQLFGGLALGLSGVGLYGVLSFSVRLRTRELGVRLALGADAGELVRDVVGQGLRLAGWGVVLGSAGALVVGRALAGRLFGVEPADPGVLGGTVALVAVVALAASLAPALRAARVDPVTAMRSE